MINIEFENTIKSPSS